MKLKRKLLIMIMINILLEINKLTSLAQAILANKSHIANFVKKKDFDNKLENLNEIYCFK